jgi:epoxide hydrolase-like predicted phosphatase
MVVQQQIRAVIFDLGGVLLRTDDPQPRTALAQRLGRSRADLENIIFGNPVSSQAEIGQATRSEVWKEIAQRLNLPEEEMPMIEQAFFAGDHVDFDLIHMIQTLRSSYTTALLSNTWNVDLETYLSNSLQILDTFDVIVSSAAFGVAKPDPRVYQGVLSLVQAKPEEAVFVDDNAANIASAAALGIHTVQFINSGQTKQALQDLLGAL